MNIFVLDENPCQAAKDLCNKHIVKMFVESAQIMSTAIRISEPHITHDGLYKSTHAKHPAVKWVLQSEHNFAWLLQHTLAVENEYVIRFKREHATARVIRTIEQLRKSVGDWSLHQPFALCMPDVHKCQDAVTSYRSYYIAEKAKFARWKPRSEPPIWWPVNLAS